MIPTLGYYNRVGLLSGYRGRDPGNRSPYGYQNVDALNQLLSEFGDYPTGRPTGISVEPPTIPGNEVYNPNTGGNISNYDFSTPVSIGGDLPPAPLSGPIPFYPNAPNTGGPFGFNPDVNFTPVPDAPLSGPPVNYPNQPNAPNVGGDDIAKFGGPFDISGGYTPDPTNNYYTDPTSGITHVYDSDWNYLYNTGSPTQQPTQQMPTNQIPSENIPYGGPTSLPLPPSLSDLTTSDLWSQYGTFYAGLTPVPGDTSGEQPAPFEGFDASDRTYSRAGRPLQPVAGSQLVGVAGR